MYAFCDNACKTEGSRYEIPYITVDHLREIVAESIILLTMNSANSKVVARQLLEEGIDDFVIINDALIDRVEIDPSKFLDELKDDAKRYRLEKISTLKWLIILRNSWTIWNSLQISNR